ncbi:MAG: DIP1984 family protein [Paludibacteraceae bacterium]|nr:DIP1984 family protein [Paludibacteraceae bacterium]
MKLAEALQIRADIQKRIAQMDSRLSNNAVVQEGEKPAEDPNQLLTELDGYLRQLEDLMVRINLTNSQTQTPNGSLTALIAHRDCLKMKVSSYHDFLESASCLARRNTHTEIKILSSVPVVDLRKKYDKLSQELRETDTQIQAANWTTDLIE